DVGERLAVRHRHGRDDAGPGHQLRVRVERQLLEVLPQAPAGAAFAPSPAADPSPVIPAGERETEPSAAAPDGSAATAVEESVANAATVTKETGSLGMIGIPLRGYRRRNQDGQL